jgi:hypothetical protein
MVRTETSHSGDRPSTETLIKRKVKPHISPSAEICATLLTLVAFQLGLVSIWFRLRSAMTPPASQLYFSRYCAGGWRISIT